MTAIIKYMNPFFNAIYLHNEVYQKSFSCLCEHTKAMRGNCKSPDCFAALPRKAKKHSCVTPGSSLYVKHPI
jgi:hypothetical protein